MKYKTSGIIPQAVLWSHIYLHIHINMYTDLRVHTQNQKKGVEEEKTEKRKNYPFALHDAVDLCPYWFLRLCIFFYFVLFLKVIESSQLGTNNAVYWETETIKIWSVIFLPGKLNEDHLWKNWPRRHLVFVFK